MSGRVANTATPETIVRLLRGAMPGGVDPKVLSITDMDKLVESLEDVLVDILKATQRPTKQLLQKAAGLAWRLDTHQSEFFATRILAAFKYCRAKRNGATTFKKVNQVVALIAKMMTVPIRLPALKANRSLKNTPSHSASPKRAGGKSKYLQGETPKANLPVASPDGTPLTTLPSTSPPSTRTASERSRSAISSCEVVSERLAALRKLYRLESNAVEVEVSSSCSVSSSQESVPAYERQSKEGKPGETLTPQLTDPGKKEAITYIESFNSFSMQMVRSYANGSEVLGCLEIGLHGFATVTFPGEAPKPTEVPNLLLMPTVPVDGKRARRAMKRPAAAPTVASVAEKLCEPAVEIAPEPSASVTSIVLAGSPASAEASPASGGAHKSSEKHRLYSKFYHSTKLRLEREGETAEAAKHGARVAARTAVAEQFGGLVCLD